MINTKTVPAPSTDMGRSRTLEGACGPLQETIVIARETSITSNWNALLDTSVETERDQIKIFFYPSTRGSFNKTICYYAQQLFT